MSAPTHAGCPLGLTPDDLSAWRDHALALEDERRITAHASACPACQQTIAAHDALAEALRAEQLPTPDPRNWSRLQARIAARDHLTSANPARRYARRPTVWGGLGAAVAVLLLSALFFRLFAQQAGVRGGSTSAATPTVVPTPQTLQYVAPTSPIAGPHLDWQSRSAPGSVIPPPGNQTDNSNIAFAPTDAQTAYICFTQSASHPSPVVVWATHDGARTWMHVSDLPAISWGPDCIINVDAHDPLRVNIVDYGQDKTIGEAIMSSISDDGGKTWRTLIDKVSLELLATRGETSVAIANPLAYLYNPQTPQQVLPSHLVISHDGFRTWSPIDSRFTAQGQIVRGVWQRPSDGALLALVATQHAVSQTTPTTTPVAVVPTHYYTWDLWASADEGASWTRFPTPPNLTGFPGYIVAQPVGSAPWMVCGLSAPNGGTALPISDKEMIGCTYDGGKTWVSLPLPALKNTCGAGCLRQQLLAPYASWLLSDGSLVTTFYAGPTDPNAVQTLSMFHAFRLLPGATQWQDLGSTSGNALMTIDSAKGGTLVSCEGGSFSSVNGATSGSIVGHLGGDIPNRGVLSFAALP